jgi:hypothetical protein
MTTTGPESPTGYGLPSGAAPSSDRLPTVKYERADRLEAELATLPEARNPPPEPPDAPEKAQELTRRRSG